VNALWLRPRPVRDPARVVVISSTSVVGDEPVDLVKMTMLEEFRNAPVFDGVAGQVAAGGLMGDFRPRLVIDRVGHAVETLAVTADYFSVLGVAVTGRGFAAEDDRLGATPVAIISDRLWKSELGGRMDVVGAVLATSHVPVRIVGVAPAGFRGARLGEQIDLWIPRTLVPRASNLAGAPDVGSEFLDRLMPLVGLARLKAGVTTAEAERAIAKPRSRFIVRPIEDVFGTPNRPTIIVREQSVLRILMVTAALVLLAGCATLLSLVLVHYERRRQELAVRLALGASRAQMARRLCLELLGLGAIGAASAMAVTAGTIRTLPALNLPGGVDLSRLDLTIDWRVAAAGLTAAGIALAVAAATPIMRFSRASLVRSLVSATTTGPPSSFRIRRTLLGLHVAATLVVLVAAGLFVRTVAYGFGRGPGFDVAHTAFLELQPSAMEFFEPAEGRDQEGEGARKAAAYARLLSGLRGLPGVEIVALGEPPIRPEQARSIDPTDVTADGVGRQMAVRTSSVPPEYLSALGVHVGAGRGLTADDVTTAGVRPAVVTASFASTLWPGASPIGREFTVRSSTYETVGVVPDVACLSLRLACARIYTASTAGPSREGVGIAVTLRARGDADGLVAPAMRVAREIFPKAPRLEVRSGRDLMALDLGQERLGAWFFSGFGLVALALGLGGVFGLVGYLAESQRRELGVRMALGATHVDLVGRIVWAGVRPVAIGTMIGLAAAAVLTRSLESVLLGVTRLDAWPYAGAATLMLGGALAGSLVAAWRIRGLSPIDALRAD
jgi:putative ABC transport system permease protein